jgi:zinc protease
MRNVAGHRLLSLALIAFVALGGSPFARADNDAWGRAGFARPSPSREARDPSRVPLNDDDPLPLDASIIRGALPNGVRYWIAPHPAAAGRAVVWMRVAAGSLDEEDGEEGLAHLVEHMAFKDTRSFPHGTLTRRLGALGLTFGSDENAFTTLRGTTYKLALPQATPAALGEAVRALADFAYRRTPTADDLAHEREVILAEMRASDGYAKRVDRKVFAATLAGSRAAVRLPLGRARVVESADLHDVDRFLARWYRPERTTILVAGDVDPAAVVALIARELGPFRARGPAPSEPPAPLATPPQAHGTRAVVITDPEQPFAEVRIVHDDRARPLRTVREYRRYLAERLALWIFGQRLRDAEDGGAPFDDAYADIETAVDGAAQTAAVYGVAPAGAWRRMLGALAGAVDRAARAGFTPAELEPAKRALVADLRARAAGAATRPAAAIAADMNQALASGQPLMSAAQRFELAEALAPLVTTAEVDAAFRARFAGSSGRLLAVILPERPGLAIPSRAQVTRIAARAAATAAGGDGQSPLPPARPIDALLTNEPRPGEIVASEVDETTGVTSVTLGNGVRVHVRSMHEREDEVRVQVTLAGGELYETSATRGLTEAAALAFDSPATETLSAAAIRSHLAGRDVDLSGCACDGDALTAELITGRADLEKGMRLLHLVLSGGRITPAALQSWKDRELEWAARTATDPELRVDAELTASLAGGDARARALTSAQIAGIDVAAAQAWFDRQRETAPMEVALVGDAPAEVMLELARKYLGTLPARPRTDERLAALRQPAGTPPVGAAAAGALIIDSVTPRAAVALGWRGPELADRAEQDRLELAAATLNDRLLAELRVRRGLTYAVSFDVTPAVALRGTGVVEASFSTDPRRAREAARLAQKLVERFAASGPTEAELATAVRQVRGRREAAARRPAEWAGRLAALDYRGEALSAWSDASARLAGIRADDVRAAVARCLAAGRTLTLVATPRSNLVLGVNRAQPPALRP